MPLITEHDLLTRKIYGICRTVGCRHIEYIGGLCVVCYGKLKYRRAKARRLAAQKGTA